MSASLDFAEAMTSFLRRRFDNPKTFSCESARAVVWQELDRAWNAEYSGVLTRDCFADLRSAVVNATRDARVMTMDMSRALMTCYEAPSIPRNTYLANVAPAAVVVRPDQYDVWRDYAGQAANQGIIRVVFLVSQLPQAQRWVACLAAGRG
jgi:hypothetical protein